MPLYIVSRQMESDSSRSDFGQLITSFEKWAHINSETWIVSSDLSIDDVFLKFKNTLSSVDSLFISEISLDWRVHNISTTSNYLDSMK